MHRLLTARIVAAALFVAACSTSTAPAGPMSVRLADASFRRTAGSAATVAYSVANDGTAAIRLTGSCGEDPAPSIERRTGGAWSQYDGGMCLAIYPVGAVVLAPGAARQSSVSLIDPGEYRLVFGTDRGRVASTAFTVR